MTPAPAALTGPESVAAALAAGRRLGLPVGSGVLLRAGSNALVHLAPTPVVARVVRLTALARARPAEALAREVQLAAWLAARGAAVVPPTTLADPGPHAERGTSLTLWSHLAGARPLTGEPAVAATALAALHDAAAGYPLERLPGLDSVVDDALGALAAGGAWLPEGARERLRALGEAARALAGRVDAAARSARAGRVLHGDAHPRNLLRTGGRAGGAVLWTDLEDAVVGPLEWDLAVMARSTAHDGAAALAAHRVLTGARPDADLLAAMRWLRDWQGACWHVLVAAVDAGRQTGALGAAADVPTDVPDGVAT